VIQAGHGPLQPPLNALRTFPFINPALYPMRNNLSKNIGIARHLYQWFD
jgi:hypothetical protein